MIKSYYFQHRPLYRCGTTFHGLNKAQKQRRWGNEMAMNKFPKGAHKSTRPSRQETILLYNYFYTILNYTECVCLIAWTSIIVSSFFYVCARINMICHMSGKKQWQEQIQLYRIPLKRVVIGENSLKLN
jgi:hypothetical protein